MTRALFLSFDGLTDPLGRSQILPYLGRLAARGHRIRLLTLDKPRPLARDGERVAALCREAGIEWQPLPYRAGSLLRNFPANLRTLQAAAAASLAAEPADLLHCRSDLAGLVGLALRRRFGTPVLYDMRAFWPDERVESGAWDQRRPLYRLLFGLFKRLQRKLIAKADGIVTLSQAGKDALPALGGGEAARAAVVIPCCADFTHFTLPDPAVRAERRAMLALADDAPLWLHLGTLGGNALVDEMLDLFALARLSEPLAHFLFLMPSGGEELLARAANRGLGGAVSVRYASREEVPGWIGAADVGAALVKPSWAKQAASPTKIGEMLATGLPIIANAGVGDVEAQVRNCRAGAVLHGFAEGDYRTALDALASVPDRATVRELARRWFDLDLAIARYDDLYCRLSDKRTRS